MVLPFTVDVLLTSIFLCGKILQNYEKRKRGLAKNLCNFRAAILFFRQILTIVLTTRSL
jgi:hypothetical protein